MNRHLFFATTLAMLWSSSWVVAQQQPGLPLPRLDTIFPLGAKVGTELPELTLTGTDLEETTQLLFSHPGIKAVEIVPAPPKVDPKDPKKQPPPPPKGPLPPNKFKVTVAPDVPLGQYDVRAVNKFGVSNPRVFTVGDLLEVLEKEPNNDVPEAQKIELNSTINGTIAAQTDVDLYVLAGKKGQRVIVSCLASSIDSKVRPLVEIHDTQGRLLASNRNYNGTNAVTDVTFAEDGDYYIRVVEFTYTAGSPQHFYRLSVTNAPWIDVVYPPMVEPGKPAQVTLYGRNLPGGTPEPGMTIDRRPVDKLVVTVNAPADSQKLDLRSRVDPRSGGVDGFEYRIKGPGGSSNPIFIAFAMDKVVLEKEGNDTPETAEEVPVPCEIAGRIDKRNDRDWFAFNAKKGEVFSIELWSERLGTPADMYFTVRAAKQMPPNITEIEKDDNPEILNNAQFYSRTTDPDSHKFTAPEDGKYLVQVASREANYLYGPRFTYRLRIGAEKPDFRLIVMPSSPSLPDVTVLRTEGHQYLDVFVFRNDGYNGPITLTAEGLPAGVTAPPSIIGSGQKAGTLVLSANASAAPFSGPIVVKGSATIAGKQIIREARPATITWGTQGQNTPAIARLDQSLVLALRDKAAFRVDIEPQNAFIKMGEKLPQPLVIKQGDKVTVPFKVARISPDAKVPVTLIQIPTGANPQQAPVTINNGAALPPVAADKNDGTFVIDVKPTAPPGMYSLVLKATAQIPYDKDPMGKNKKPLALVQSSVPVIVQVLPLSVAKVTVVGPMGNSVKASLTADVVVKVERQFDYAGELKVKLVFPMGAKGVTADEVTLPAGQNEVKIVVKAAPDATVGALNNIVAQATAVIDGKFPIVQEAKFNLNVDKMPAPAPPKK